MADFPRDIERLAFSVRVARDESTLKEAVALRQAVRPARHADRAAGWGEPEPDDLRPDSTVWIAESKNDGAALGSMRMLTNVQRPLNLEKLVTLPPALQGQTLSDISHLAAAPGPLKMMVVIALLKANLLLLQARGIAWSMIAAQPPMSRVYRDLMLYDASTAALGSKESPEPGSIEVLAFEVATARARFEAAGHAARHFLFDTHHPDIQID